jgi:NAD(P)-dependent dehydrogenase (short-subunit alcohol dehydrogenase family)
MTGKWTTADMPGQAGRTALVTGANTGIGFEAALGLAVRGATVILGCRDVEKARQAATRITQNAPGSRVETLPIDLASLASVREAAEMLRARHERLDLLINNAGLMMPPHSRTEDGFELQLGTNHLGHFALTGLVLHRLLATPGSRIVTVSSNGHKRGKIDFDDLHWEHRRYRRFDAYTQSKLANLLFTYELQRRLADAGATTVAVAAHPGGSRTDLGRHSSPIVRAAMSPRTRLLFLWLIQDASMGALPTLRAAADPDVHGGDYYGPDGWMEGTGHPTKVESSARSHDVDAQRRLWDVSERLTGVTFQIDVAAGRTNTDQR